MSKLFYGKSRDEIAMHRNGLLKKTMGRDYVSVVVDYVSVFDWMFKCLYTVLLQTSKTGINYNLYNGIHIINFFYWPLWSLTFVVNINCCKSHG